MARCGPSVAGPARADRSALATKAAATRKQGAAHHGHPEGRATDNAEIPEMVSGFHRRPRTEPTLAIPVLRKT